MLACPSCTNRLNRAAMGPGVAFVCLKCGGKAVAFSVLRKQADPSFLKKLWQSAYASRRKPGRRCPHCDGPMAPVRIVGRRDLVELDVCVRCQCVWFDPREYERIPPAGAGEGPEMAPRAREAAARFRTEAQARSQPEAAVDTEGPDSAWQYVPAILGLPVELDASATVSKPLLTWGLSAVAAVIFFYLWGMGALQEAIAEWGFIPNQWQRHSGLTLLTGFFLHGGLFHLISNLYFFLVFGDNVEDHLGKVRYLFLLAAAHVVGTFLHGAFDPRGDIPAIGASAGIAGVIAYYAVAFPHAKLGFLFFFFFFYVRWIRISAIWALVLYLGLQALGAWQQLQGFSNVSALAHLGGLGVGIVVGLVARLSGSRRPT